MCSVKLGYNAAITRINNLLNNGHFAEALVATTVTIEKTIRRTLRQIIVSAGFKSKDAERLINEYRGLESIKKHWDIFDPRNRSLISVIGNSNWQIIKSGADMRNKLVHGIRVYDLAECETQARNLLQVLDHMKDSFDQIYDYSGWEKLKVRRKSTLHNKPLVNV
ncbi:MAG: hypothetical protein KKA19_01415 [Candidatus Margulisbacteria bacterium]|nr:hypothetical protein [Candidatus Margulisiibacteriota bacterium]